MKQLIEKYSVYIGIGLVVIALIGGVLLMIKKGAGASSSDQTKIIEENNKKISELETKVAGLQKENEALKAGSQTEAKNESSNQQSGKININTATAAQLDSLPGIGPVYAGRIVEYRDSHGGFKSINEIENVKGIGPKTFEKFRDKITI
ncbi:hypothetical protein CO019_01940 [Candidatus Berkelbacteria bacterium CG_4_9_14_0_2_um_filter_42_30]|uniref:Helix-hairpin-helix DNA-binding motif class 1 domain-containing protein n=6 Tax=Candidatus Berkelbacteria TaxID=1618330 RepID=A0A2M7K148_9BACT|nr:MAG: hypothetical protein AUJ40_00665 [Candidatus Berkelbacteria bacterium CG1_02_42_45]PIP51038.1 MAG: hypothetical protein COX11_00790 [Candidatus Berkelbacteria bacterium CG23_combo_of_CG06-09_8_20_14_all_41_73]PIR27366.1 MAG: hypothetical protein COV40_01310 [Candidatus Berkelbacteria bacterium CG11_big_fil_rev_8_21_14_0_20_42_15]PIX29987.1 MAG: hypothetical protein COZ63_02125 [Candidatus Berkelbacteria bacterium CG_4_8_14_3_um_filter_42_13]PIZ27375.1 MAG: hypothetical protein COY45_028